MTLRSNRLACGKDLAGAGIREDEDTTLHLACTKGDYAGGVGAVRDGAAVLLLWRRGTVGENKKALHSKMCGNNGDRGRVLGEVVMARETSWVSD